MEGVAPNIEELVRNLRHQISLYRQLLDLVREERLQVVELKYKELRESTFSKEALIDEIQREEQRRKLWVHSAAQFIGLPEKDTTLEIIASRIAREQYEALMSLKNTLVVLVKKSRELNEDNRKLVEAALRDTQEMKKNVLGLTSEQAKVYGPRGQMNTKENTSRILNKEA
jgi:flagellar biosynthesis/type III secretory pathway chaperone